MTVDRSRRNFLFLSAMAASAAAGAVVWRGRTPEWARGPKLRDGHPILRMPVRAGLVVLCQQGNSSPPGHTHSGGNCLYALDLSNCAENIVDIVAAAPGRVSFVYGQSKPGDFNAGLRFGNQIKVDHGRGYFSFYSHLEKIMVREGDIVRSGDPLGTMGFTGAAGNRHLHFSLHQGLPLEPGVGDSIPMRAVVTAPVERNFNFQSMPSSEFIAGETNLWAGRVYGSENSPDEPVLDREARGELRERLRDAQERLRIIVDHRIKLDEVAENWQTRGATWAEQILKPILDFTPKHALARYWFGTAVLLNQKKWDEAENVYRELLDQGMAEATWEMWLRSWIHNRLGIVALARERPDDARALFRMAFELATANPERAFAGEHLQQLGSSPENLR